MNWNDELQLAVRRAKEQGQQLNLAGWCPTGHHRECQRRENSNPTLRAHPCECPCHRKDKA